MREWKRATAERVAARRPCTHAPSPEEPAFPCASLRKGCAFHVTRSSPQPPSSLLGGQCRLHARGRHSAVTGLVPGRLPSDTPPNAAPGLRLQRDRWLRPPLEQAHLRAAFSISLSPSASGRPQTWALALATTPAPASSLPWSPGAAGRQGTALRPPRPPPALPHGCCPPIPSQSSRQAPSLTSDASSSVGGLGALPHRSSCPSRLPLLSSPASLLMATLLPTCLLTTQACRAS